MCLFNFLSYTARKASSSSALTSSLVTYDREVRIDESEISTQGDGTSFINPSLLVSQPCKQINSSIEINSDIDFEKQFSQMTQRNNRHFENVNVSATGFNIANTKDDGIKVPSLISIFDRKILSHDNNTTNSGQSNRIQFDGMNFSTVSHNQVVKKLSNTSSSMTNSNNKSLNSSNFGITSLISKSVNSVHSTLLTESNSIQSQQDSNDSWTFSQPSSAISNYQNNPTDKKKHAIIKFHEQMGLNKTSKSSKSHVQNDVLIPEKGY